MKKLSYKGMYPEHIDAECIELCDTLNSIKGITTFQSCCGHKDSEFHIFFKCDSIEALTFIQSCIDVRYWKYGSEWSIELSILDRPACLSFLLRSKSTNLKEIMFQVKDMIETFNYYLNHKNRFELFEFDYDNFIFTETE